MTKTKGNRLARAALDNVTLELVDIEDTIPFLRQRIEQALRRTGLTDLLQPAMEECDRMAADVVRAKGQVSAAISAVMSVRGHDV